jgi:F-type H+-transporting ATPase subunit epsilon
MSLPTSIDLQVLTPERMLVHQQVDEVEIPGADGYFGVLPGHTPLLAALKTGELWYRVGQQKTYVAIAYGFAEVLPDRVSILARLAEKAEDIDVERAEAARRRALELLSQPDVDYERAGIALAKSLTRLQVASYIATGVSQRPRV